MTTATCPRCGRTVGVTGNTLAPHWPKEPRGPRCPQLDPPKEQQR